LLRGRAFYFAQKPHTKEGKMQLESLVMFCILMENNEGILGKSPDYILEKFNRASQSEGEEMLGALDAKNQAKYQDWKQLWLEKVKP
jgi:predicted transposase YdaD